ncbi:LAMI_0B08086g1_1 [Lachancea mirantina]|uniref:LAMI_0B08086g1_1 n=1 Tax=Lachancea mirantina TaxID=1230905 RepID=A0A1G4IY71_9SACH|nr:LAMI_0B08086g1_1 [Lachancea mirantina]
MDVLWSGTACLKSCNCEFFEPRAMFEKVSQPSLSLGEDGDVGEAKRTETIGTLETSETSQVSEALAALEAFKTLEAWEQEGKEVSFKPAGRHFQSVTHHRCYFTQALFHEQVKAQSPFLDPKQVTRFDGINVQVRFDVNDDKVRALPCKPYVISPFALCQVVFLATPKNSCVCAAKVDSFKTKGRTVTLNLTAYSWFPLKTLVSQTDGLKVLICGAQTRRMLDALLNVQNSRLQTVVMCKQPLHHKPGRAQFECSTATLNKHQRHAVAHSLSNKITILKGPPGTGKTTVIVEMIAQLLQEKSKLPILCVAPSNVAIDNIAKKLLADKSPIAKRDLLRVVSISKEPHYWHGHVLEDICLHLKMYEHLTDMPKRSFEDLIAGRYSKISPADFKAFQTQRRLIEEKIIRKAKVILTTNVAAGAPLLKCLRSFPVVIMDESTQATEPSALVPLTLPNVRKVILLGDERQLSCANSIPGLTLSFFERLITNRVSRANLMLRVQYRMHPQISEFPRTAIYNGQLTDGCTAEDRKHPQIKHPLFFLQCARTVEQLGALNQADHKSIQNPGEARVVRELVRNLLLEKQFSHSQIAVITPYAAQRELVAKLLKSDPVINPRIREPALEMDIEDVIGSGLEREHNSVSNTLININNVYVSSIDAFQGHERDVIIFSSVRNNSEASLGFLTDRRRLNVALTRARRALAVVGDKETLKNSKIWRKFLKHLQERDLIFEKVSSL